MAGHVKKPGWFLTAVFVMLLVISFPGKLAVCASESFDAAVNSAGSYESVPGLCIADDTANSIYRPAVVFSLNTSKTSGAGVYTAYHENDAKGSVINVQGYSAAYGNRLKIRFPSGISARKRREMLPHRLLCIVR